MKIRRHARHSDVQSCSGTARVISLFDPVIPSLSVSNLFAPSGTPHRRGYLYLANDGFWLKVRVLIAGRERHAQRVISVEGNKRSVKR
jgi:hypothetical protein